MAPKKEPSPKRKSSEPSAVIENAGIVLDQPITETLEKNYMPYAMSVIVSRAIPEIDGFKPSHRKLLYTMYKMGLLTGSRTKSANIVGQTMKLNPHGDAAIYETMVRLSRSNEALLHGYVDSKGNFGKAYSRDMAYAASRYTEAKLAAISNELFEDVDSDTVDFVDNYDNTTKEPTLLPVTFPSVLVNSNMGIAVGMASSICSFNLAEVCETTIALMKNPDHDLLSTLKAPDFASGGNLIYNEEELRNIYKTGRGGMKIRAKYTYDKANNCIDITELPTTTTTEAIIDKVVDMIRQSKIREIADMRDETDLHGLKLTIDLRRGIDPDKLMLKLFKMTPLQDTFSCNFNILVGGSPRLMGIVEILSEWIAFRKHCVKRKVRYILAKKQEKMHLLEGLAKILLDIDKAVKVVRDTPKEAEVVPNLMIEFGVDEIQAEYVAEIKLRHLNREYILKRTEEISSLEEEIAGMKDILSNDKKVEEMITAQLKAVSKKYGLPRKTLLYFVNDEENEIEEEDTPSHPVNIFFTKEGYFKKITPQSLRLSGEQKLKEGDKVIEEIVTKNNARLLFFTERGQVYKAGVDDFSDTKASVLGEFIPAKLGMEEGESAVYLAVTTDYKGYMLFFFENGKVAKVDLMSYHTKLNRKKLIGAFSDKSKLVAAYHITQDAEFLMVATNERALIVDSAALVSKTTKNTAGVQVLTLKNKLTVEKVVPFTEDMMENSHKYRTKSLPAAGSFLREDFKGEQLTLE